MKKKDVVKTAQMIARVNQLIRDQPGLSARSYAKLLDTRHDVILAAWKELVSSGAIVMLAGDSVPVPTLMFDLWKVYRRGEI